MGGPTLGIVINGRVSFWQHQLGEPPRRPPLTQDIEADVAIVGGGYTGLWTAHYLNRLDPGLRVVVVEREFCGYGASGRNGGWLTAALPGSRETYARDHGREGVLALQAALIDAVGEVERFTHEEGVDVDLDRSGVVSFATDPVQETRLRAEHAGDLAWGLPESRLLGAHDAGIRVAGATLFTHSPHAARIHPAKLVRGLAGVVESRGVHVVESTPVTALDGHRVTTPGGEVRAQVVVRATEGFTAGLPGQRRTWLPMNSCLIVTEPLPDRVWDEIGWERPFVLGDSAHAYMYAQRTADGRIAIGGRGVPYRFGSRTDRGGEVQPRAVQGLTELLHRYFPATAGAAVDHAWAGVLGVPRDWCASVGHDEQTGAAWAGGYTGHGVAAANLAGRTLADLVTGTDSERTTLPWVGHEVRRWEPEPARWLGVRSLYVAYRAADRTEARTGRPSWLARAADVVSGKP